MKLLYKAYACEDLRGDGSGKVLIPGCPVIGEADFHPGDRLRIEFADGTWLGTTVVCSETVDVNEVVARRFPPVRCGRYVAAKVPRTFSHPEMKRGALVYLDVDLA